MKRCDRAQVARSTKLLATNSAHPQHAADVAVLYEFATSDARICSGIKKYLARRPVSSLAHMVQGRPVDLVKLIDDADITMERAPNRFAIADYLLRRSAYKKGRAAAS